MVPSCEGGRVTSDVSMGVVVGSLDIILIAHYVLPTITRLIHDQARESQPRHPHAANGEDKYINDRTLVQHQHYTGEILFATLLFMTRDIARSQYKEGQYYNSAEYPLELETNLCIVYLGGLI